ncbi:MAG: guanosine-5'-triphosphate,3'-diphosphate pyrophosphatase [Idiomarina sp.]|nr:guanosine-5'-triphosphate,3'-diphosphate pyrophosphatase [Idiomarina sp.]
MSSSRSKDYYAAIDLGSNSFHMLVVRVVAGGVQVVSKIKRKVRLAAGLHNNQLDQAAKARALECLRIFSDRVEDIDPSHIRAVGTATLRKISADQAFIEECERTLGHPIDIISGDEEAATIYQGIAHTTSFAERMLIIDIGGASTELVLGEGFQADVLNSLDMGCVTWYSRYFAEDNGHIDTARCTAAIAAARVVIDSVSQQYQNAGQGLVLGASGTFKALQEIAHARHHARIFTLRWLRQLLEEAIACGDHDALNLKGLKAERRSVFVSGLCILIGLCESLGIKQFQATSGALREGVIYALLAKHHAAEPNTDVQLRTLEAITATYHLDADQVRRVQQQAVSFSAQVNTSWSLPANSSELIRAVSYLHELGLSLAYKQASSHATYMVQHLDMPGFSEQVRSQLVTLLAACAGIIDDENDPAVSDDLAMRHLERILRLSIMLCQRRSDERTVNYQLTVKAEALHLHAPAGFFSGNPFLTSLLVAEQAELNAPECLSFAQHA